MPNKQTVLCVKLERPGRVSKNLVCLPAEEVANVIAAAHSSLEGGNEKSNKTVERIM